MSGADRALHREGTGPVQGGGAGPAHCTGGSPGDRQTDTTENTTFAIPLGGSNYGSFRTPYLV